VPDNGSSTRQLRDIVDQVVSRDPGAVRIGVRERHRRLEADVSYARERLAGCIAQRGGDLAPAEQLLQSELQAFADRLGRSAPLDQDTIEAGIDLIDRAESAAVASCGPASAVDRALLLIAGQHGAAPQ
jgi:hypothetical protein